MKEKLREQFICCMLAVMLFLSGMCVEMPHADTSFLYAKKEAPITQSTGSVLSDGSRLTTIERVCTITMLKHDATTLLSSNRIRNLMRRTRDVVALLAAAMLLLYLFCFGRVTGEAFWKLTGSHATIVRYIQQTDGKK